MGLLTFLIKLPNKYNLFSIYSCVIIVFKDLFYKGHLSSDINASYKEKYYIIAINIILQPIWTINASPEFETINLLCKILRKATLRY